MTTLKHLFLDLEDTIITPVLDGWLNTRLINVEKVKKVIQEYAPDMVHLFSFAIWNEQELLRFNLDTRLRLEQVLNIKLCLIPTLDDDIIPACCKVMNLGADYVTFQDVNNFWGKQMVFKLFLQKHFENTIKHGIHTEVMLLDDVVFNEQFSWPDMQINGIIQNIDSI